MGNNEQDWRDGLLLLIGSQALVLRLQQETINQLNAQKAQAQQAEEDVGFDLSATKDGTSPVPKKVRK